MKKILFLFGMCFIFSQSVYAINVDVEKTVENILMLPFTILEGVVNSVDNIANRRKGLVWESPQKKLQREEEQKAEEERQKHILQIEDEEKFINENTNLFNVTILSHPVPLLQEDYSAYMNGKGSLYGTLAHNVQEYNKNSKESRKDDIEVLNRIMEAQRTVANDKAPLVVMVKNEQYSKINSDTKRSLILFNLLNKQDKTELINIVYEEYNKLVEDYKTKSKNAKTMKELAKIVDEVEEETNNANLIKEMYKNKTLTSKDYQAESAVANIYKDLDNLKTELFNKGYNYEKTKYSNWAVKNNKKIALGAMENVVYNTIYSSTPQANIIYKHAPRGHFWLRVQQSVPGGIILTGDSRMGTYNYNQVFLQTSRNFADNQLLSEGFMAEFKGYYEYTTVLGARRKIYKFKELNDKEIKSNFEIPGQPFYFYQPY